MTSAGFLAELKRRHVIRVGLAYLVVGLLTVLSAIWIVPLLSIPAALVRGVMALVGLGFPVALVLAWAYEFTPDGLRRTEPAHSGHVRDPRHARIAARNINIILFVLLLATSSLILWRGFGSVAPPSEPALAPPVPADPAAGEKSIAVLPFESLSVEEANRYFAGGIQDEILTNLSRIADLKVISRGSTLRYAGAGAEVDIGEIARQLDVAYLLAGSVQKDGDRVRINVQLIEARNESQVWVKTYDRKLDDVFAVESEVAQVIADSLQARLTEPERTAMALRPTTNSEAYALWLKGRALNETSSYDRATTAELLSIHRQAVALDPGFVLAWAELVKLNIWEYWEGYDGGQAGLDAARTALAKAEALAPDLPEVKIARGWFLYYGERQFAAALAAFHAAQRGLPNNDQALVGSALVERRLGRWELTTRDLERARVLNPNGLEILAVLGESLIAMREFDRAESAIDAGLKLKPSDPYLLDMKAICLFNGNREWSEIDRILAEFPLTPAGIGSRATSNLLQRRFDDASELFEQAITASGKDDSPDNYKDYIPTTTAMRLGLALSEQRAGRIESAASVYQAIKRNAQASLGNNPDHTNVRAALHAVLGMAEAGLGDATAAVADGERAAALIPEATDAIDGPAWTRYLARIHAQNGDADRALPLLTHLLDVTTTDPQTIRLLEIDPIWDSLRKDPRFRKLVADDPAAQANQVR